MSFVHIHVHSHFSVLDGMSKIADLIDKAVDLGMPALALTDHGHMYGAKEFTDYAKKVSKKYKEKVAACQEKLEQTTDADEKAKLTEELESLKAKQAFKPIVGVEAYCARRTLYDKDKAHKAYRKSGKEYIVDSSGYHLILLAMETSLHKFL